MTNRKLLIALVASLALNLFLVGAVLGGLVIGERLSDGRRPGVRGQPLIGAANDLPRETRQAFRHMLRAQAQDLGEDLRDSRQARAQAWRRLGADPADPAQVKLDLAQARAGELQARAIIDGAIVDFVAGLPAPERALLARGLAHGGPGMGDRLHSKGRRGEP